jgi:hypothetical protein
VAALRQVNDYPAADFPSPPQPAAGAVFLSYAGEEIGRERTLDRARGTPFLLPVVVDDTREAAALVPEPFMRLPWTRLPQGAVTPIFPSR